MNATPLMNNKKLSYNNVIDPVSLLQKEQETYLHLLKSDESLPNESLILTTSPSPQKSYTSRIPTGALSSTGELNLKMSMVQMVGSLLPEGKIDLVESNKRESAKRQVPKLFKNNESLFRYAREYQDLYLNTTADQNDLDSDDAEDDDDLFSSFDQDLTAN